MKYAVIFAVIFAIVFFGLLAIGMADGDSGPTPEECQREWEARGPSGEGLPPGTPLVGDDGTWRFKAGDGFYSCGSGD